MSAWEDFSTHFYFYPRPPRGGRQLHIHGLFHLCHDFYPRPPRGGRPNAVQLILEGRSISIHALREEGDVGAVRLNKTLARAISIHALREEGDRAVR